MTVLSKPRRTRDEYQSMELKKAELGVPPAIDFWKPMVTKADEDDIKKKKDTFTTITIPLQLDGDSTANVPSYERHVKIFKEGTAEEYCHHLYVCEELYKKLGYDKCWPRTSSKRKKDDKGKHVKDDDGAYVMEEVTDWYDSTGKEVAKTKQPWRTYSRKMALLISTLGGRALQSFEQSVSKYENYKRYIPGEDSDDDGEEIPYTTEEVYASALNDLSKLCFSHPDEAAKTQKRYIREGGLLFCGEYISPMAFHAWLTYVNQMLQYFPWVKRANGAEERPMPLDDDKLMEILDKARSIDIRKLMLTLGDSARKYTSPQQYAIALEQWHENVVLTKTLEEREQRKRKDNPNTNGNPGSPTKRRRKKKGNGGDPKGDPKFQRTKPCVHCGKNHLVPDDQCWTLEKNKHKKPNFSGRGAGKSTQNKDAEKIKEAVSRQVEKATKQIKSELEKKYGKKCKVIEDSSDDEDVRDNFAAKMKISATDNISSDESECYLHAYSLDAASGDAIEGNITNITWDRKNITNSSIPTKNIAIGEKNVIQDQENIPRAQTSTACS